MVVFSGLAAVGFLALGLGWRITAHTYYVSEQIPALVSGGLGGLAFIVLGLGLTNIQTDRLREAQEQRLLSELLRTARQIDDQLARREQP